MTTDINKLLTILLVHAYVWDNKNYRYSRQRATVNVP